MRILSVSKACVCSFFLAILLLHIPQAVAKTTALETVEGKDIIGTKAPEFSDLEWVNSKPLTIAGLKGKAVLVRFWLGYCSLCQRSIPALKQLEKQYKDKGLVVIGIHHPKGRGSLGTREKVDVIMHQWGFSFPVALDNKWTTIKKFWVGKDRNYTSASILIDKNGIIRWVHPGGALLRPLSVGDPDGEAFVALDQEIKNVLK
ncbi:MAG: redoxin domain-containing protein [Candidatus Melainabacteria bacterium]|nr:redoxin domain-containing protein [Candidatus Melainabacteria bacterium]